MTTGRGSDVVDERALTIFTDGSRYGGPARGGVGMTFVWVDAAGEAQTHEEFLAPTSGATNNQMELEAVSAALEFAESRRAPFQLSQLEKVEVRTDSQYVAENLGRARYQWSQNRWMRSGGAAVLNVRDWKRLLTTLRRYDREHRKRVRIDWIPGKKGTYAKGVDKLAKMSATSPLRARVRPSIVRRRTTSRPLEVGSVKVTGQTFVVRIVKAQDLPQKRGTTRYAYEVISDGPDVDAADWAESELPLRPNHTYRVRMNADQRNPRIEELLEELEEDLDAYRGTVAAIGRPATAREVAAQLARSSGTAPTTSAVRRRLDMLFEAGELERERRGHAYVYQPAVAEEPARPANGST